MYSVHVLQNNQVDTLTHGRLCQAKRLPSMILNRDSFFQYDETKINSMRETQTAFVRSSPQVVPSLGRGKTNFIK